MLVTINGVDITEHIDPNSYTMNVKKQYESWDDGNFRQHRIYIRDKIEGSFTVVLYGRDGMDTQEFLDTWNGAVNNNIVTLLVFVQNLNDNQAISAYFEFEGKFHREMINGKYCDKLTIKIEEQ